MNLCVFRFIVFCSYVVSGFACFSDPRSTDCKWPNAEHLPRRDVSGPEITVPKNTSPLLRTDTSSHKNKVATSKNVRFEGSVTVSRMHYDEDSNVEHVHSNKPCEKPLNESSPHEEEDAQPRESAYNFVALINSMLYESDIETDDPVIREAVKDRVLNDAIADLNKRKISITADIFDAVRCRVSELTTDEMDLFLHFSVGSSLVSFELFKMAPHRVQDFENILAKSTMERSVHKVVLKKTADEVLKIAHSFAPSARLCASDVLAFSQKFLSRNELSTYELIDFARVIIKRESWWALMWTYADHDTLHNLCDMDR